MRFVGERGAVRVNGQEKLLGMKRTAVLVVHGMGLQRPLETVRGIVDAVWIDEPASASGKRIWSHPDRRGTDIDLRVFSTSTVPDSDPPRRVEFYELYWAHLMSETRALAVLLWLFELARKGPRLKPSIRAVWWGAAIFLELLIFSVSLIAVKAIQWFTETSDSPDKILVAPMVMFLILGVAGLIVSANYGAWKLAGASAALAMGLAILIWLAVAVDPQYTAATAKQFLPLWVAAVATYFLMGYWGVLALIVTYGLSFLFEFLLRMLGRSPEWMPWTLESQWCAVAAWIIVATYLVINAAFLQPYLGDAARYFRDAPSNVAVRRAIRREAVEMLETLHLSGQYDRIVIVAHSLGTVVAYDMLRAYFGRISRDLPTSGKELGAHEDERFRELLEEVDSMRPASVAAAPEMLREKAREIVRYVVRILDAAKHSERAGAFKAWMVTDFVTLGSPLTHAYYLMCRVPPGASRATHKRWLCRLWTKLKGPGEADLRADFERRVYEREFPICPPKRCDDDGLLLFSHEQSGTRWFHNGALFGLTRWTNLYFPASELFQGDAIGGPVDPAFGGNPPSGAIYDIEVSTRAPMPKRKGFLARIRHFFPDFFADFFTHVSYWDIARKDGRKAPHIVVLRNAIDLADRGRANRKTTLMP